jgi:nucleoside-diphosphate-sugar epimerase
MRKLEKPTTTELQPHQKNLEPVREKLRIENAMLHSSDPRPSEALVCLVTGAAGFIGSHVAEALLARGHHVIGVDDMNDFYSPKTKYDNLTALLASDRFSFHEEDVNGMSSESLPSRIDFVFHLAGQPGVRTSWSTCFDAYVSRNILATQRLLELLLSRSVRRLIFASSSSVYGHASEPVVESRAPHPLSPYAATKLGAEGLCLAYGAGYDIPITILRYFTVYGPRQRPDMAIHKLIQAALTRTSVPIFGDGNQSRAFTFVSDVVDATLAAMSDAPITSIYNISGGERATLSECLEVIEGFTRSRILRHLCQAQRGDPYEIEADISQAQSHLGFRPKVSLERGIAHECQWMQAQTSAHAVA